MEFVFAVVVVVAVVGVVVDAVWRAASVVPVRRHQRPRDNFERLSGRRDRARVPDIPTTSLVRLLAVSVALWLLLLLLLPSSSRYRCSCEWTTAQLVEVPFSKRPAVAATGSFPVVPPQCPAASVREQPHRHGGLRPNSSSEWSPLLL